MRVTASLFSLTNPWSRGFWQGLQVLFAQVRSMWWRQGWWHKAQLTSAIRDWCMLYPGFILRKACLPCGRDWCRAWCAFLQAKLSCGLLQIRLLGSMNASSSNPSRWMHLLELLLHGAHWVHQSHQRWMIHLLELLDGAHQVYQSHQRWMMHLLEPLEHIHQQVPKETVLVRLCLLCGNWTIVRDTDTYRHREIYMRERERERFVS